MFSAKMAKKTSSKRRKLVIDDDDTSSPAAEAIVSIEDLLTEILLRVPAKSLIRFKCVSKNWLRLISDSHFAFNHARRNRSCSSVSGLYFYNPCSSKEQVNSLSLHGHHSLPRLAFHDISSEESTTKIKSSCNGLLLCENRRKVWHVYGSRYVVCNLTTQNYTLLSSRTVHGGFPAYLAFDPSKSPHYKVLSVRHCDKMDIYSSENSSWKRIDFTEPESSLGGVFWNGAIHWLGYDNVHIRFDIDAEKLIETQMPPNPKILSDDKIRYFGECGGRLLLIQTHRRSAMGFRILEMDGDYSGWSVKCRVNLRPLISEFPGIDQRIGRHNFHLLCVVKGENENDFALVLLIPRPGKVIVYNVKRKTTKVLRDLLPGDFDGFIFHPCPRAPFQFIESLSPV